MNPIPTFPTLPDTLNALLRAAVEDGDGADHAFWSYCSSELHRLQTVHAKLADDAKSFETRMRHRSIAKMCESLASAGDDEDLLADLRASAVSALERAKKAQGEGKVFLLAEFRLCMMMADLDYEDFGLTRDVFLAYLEQCAEPA